MNFLHRFLPQPCFDNASAEGGTAGGRGGVNRTSTGARSTGIGMQSGGGYKEKAQGIPGYGTPQEGRAMNQAAAAASRGGGDGGAGGGRGGIGVSSPSQQFAPLPTRPVATPVVAAPPVATPMPAPAAPKATAPIGPSGYASLDALAAQKMGVPTSDIQSFQSAPTPATPSRSLSPSTRSTPAQAAAARSVGQQAAAQRASQAVSATPGGRAGGVGTPGVGGGFGPSVSNAAAKSDRGVPSVSNVGAKSDRGLGSFGGNLDGPGAIGIGAARGIGSANTPSNVAGKSDFGVPGLNSRSDMAGLIGRQSFGGSSSVNKSAPAQSVPGGISNLSDAEISGTIGDIVAGRPDRMFGGLSPVGSFATNQPSVQSMARQEALQGLPAARGYSAPTMSATPTTGTKAIQDRLSVSPPGPTPSLGSRAVNEMVKQGVPSMRDQNFYSSDNAYEGVNFPSVNDAYPTSAAALPGGYSSTPEGAWSQNAPSFASPMEAAENMGIMDQMRALNMFTRGSVPPARNDGTNRGGETRTRKKERNAAKKAIAEAIAPRKSGWTPYTGSSRFANWTPIMKALMNG